MSTAKNAIFKAKIEGIVTELMFKTDAANVYVDDSTTLAAKLASIIADIATKASTTELTNGLATKAAKSHTHAQSEITGLTDALANLASNASVTKAIDDLRQEMLGDTPVEAYNTFTELAAYIAEHKEVSDALSAAVGNKADKATTLSGYGITDAYTKTQVDTAVGKKADKATTLSGYGITDAYTKTQVDSAISTATGGVSAKDVNDALTTYKSSNDTRVSALETAKHTHSNKTVLDGITSSVVTGWNAKSKVYFSSTEPTELTANDLWVQLVE